MEQLLTSPIRTLILDDSAEGGDVIANLLRTEPGFSVTVAPVAFGEGARSARRYEPDVVVLVADTMVGSDPIIVIEELEGVAPGAAIIVLTAGQSATTRELILAGARDCLAPPYSREVLAASVRAAHSTESRRRERLTASITGGLRRHRCRVIAVHGAKGGVGTTTVAVNLAVALRKISGERVVLLDASLQTGDIGVTLNLAGNSGIDNLLPHLNGLDADLLDKVLVTHASGVRALLAPRDLERAEAVGGEEIRRILAFMSSHFDYIVIDTAPTLDAAGLAALDHADRIVLLTVPEIPALKNAGRFVQLCRRLGYPPEKISLVLNRANSKQAIPRSEIERNLGIKPIATIPSAGKLFVRAANRGEVVVDTNMRGASRSFYQLATQLTVSGPERRRWSLFSWVPALRGALLRRGGQTKTGENTTNSTVTKASSATS